MQYRADIDGLRAVAVLSVVLFHAGLVGLSGGFIGVDVFFVISGYLICSIVAEELRRDDFSIVRFYERRFRRIMPALFAMFSVTSIAATLVLMPPDLEDFSHSLIASTLFVSNVYFWKNTGYFDGTSEFKPLLHTWSLSVEEQFYIVTPLLLFAIARWFSKRYLACLLPIALLSFAVSVWGVERAPNAAFYVLPTRFWELLAGALLGLCPPPTLARRGLRELCAGAGIALIAGAAVFFSDETPFPGSMALLPCLGTCLVIYAGLGGPTLVSSWLGTRPMVFIGAISYSLYLWHWPVFSLYRYQVGRELLALEAAALVGLGFFLAVLSWRFIEQPFRRKLQPIGRRAIFVFSGAGMLVMLGLAAPASLTEGLAFRFPNFVLEPIPGPERYNEHKCFLDDNQSLEEWGGAECFVTRGRGKNVLLWGDSFAAQYVPGIADNAAFMTADVLQYTQSLCPPIFGFSTAARPRCEPFNANVVQVIRDYEIRAVVMAGRWDYAFKRHVEPSQIADTIARVRALGVDVYVIGQSPLFGHNVQTLFAKSGGTPQTAHAAGHITFTEEINQKLARAAAGATFIDPVAKLCDRSSCPYRHDGQFLIWDVGHFSEYGSRLAVLRYFPFLRSQ